MQKTDWNAHLDYLRESRKRWFHPDYLEFLVRKVWCIDKPIRVADYACGLGYLGSALMPFLPKGSTYTGFDSAEILLNEARREFQPAEFEATFICCDLENEDVKGHYDLVICQAFLMHISKPDRMLKKMIDTAVEGGLIICIENNWNVSNAALHIEGLDVDANCNLGILAKLWMHEKNTYGSDKFIGTKVPSMMQKLGLNNVSIRLNDCTRFINPFGEQEEYNRQFETLYADGWGREIGDEEPYIKTLCERGLTKEEARIQYQCEKRMNDHIRAMGNDLMALTFPPMFISFGWKV